MEKLEPEPTKKSKINKIPLGISTFDQIIRGGVPSGSMILLIGESGAGNIEFAYTSLAMLSLMKNDHKTCEVESQVECPKYCEDQIKLPENICYISFTHGKEDFMRELDYAFPSEFSNIQYNRNFIFKDISYLCSAGKKTNIPGKLKSIMELNAGNSLVILDSLTRLIRISGLKRTQIVSFLEDIQRRSKRWDGLVYLLLGSGIIGHSMEEEIMDIADGVLVFEWAQEGFLRQQSMYIRKFRGIMPHISKENIVRLDTMVTNTDGFMVTNVKRISGRK